MKKIISAVLIIAGLALLVSPLLMDKMVERQVKISTEAIERITVEEIEFNKEIKSGHKYTEIKDINPVSAAVAVSQFEDSNIIGLLRIPELEIDLPILNGVSDANLMAGAGTMVPDLTMGAGNFSVASHYMKNPKLLFGNLLNAKEGMEVKITDKRNIYEYVIYETVLVPETALYMLDTDRADERGKPIISLMTCYYTSKNGKRFFALGELVDTYEYEDDKF
ncbi:MAG: class A sortase [Gudongella sp.]|jgi:sortase A|nr:class A sortase [Gudongella sp.]